MPDSPTRKRKKIKENSKKRKKNKKEDTLTPVSENSNLSTDSQPDIEQIIDNDIIMEKDVEQEVGSSISPEIAVSTEDSITSPSTFSGFEPEAFKRIKVRGETEVSSFVEGNEGRINSVKGSVITQKDSPDEGQIVKLKTTPPKPGHPMPLIVKANGGGYGVLNIFRTPEGKHIIITAAHVVRGRNDRRKLDVQVTEFLKGKTYIKDVNPQAINIDLDKDIAIIEVEILEESPSWPVSNSRTLTEKEVAAFKDPEKPDEIPELTVSSPFEDIPFRPVTLSRKRVLLLNSEGQVKYGYTDKSQKTQGGESGSAIVDMAGNIVGVHNLSGMGSLFI